METDNVFLNRNVNPASLELRASISRLRMLADLEWLPYEESQWDEVAAKIPWTHQEGKMGNNGKWWKNSGFEPSDEEIQNFFPVVFA